MKIDSSIKILREAVSQFAPTHIVSMVSGGKDSAASDAIARELGVKIDFVIHGNTRTGIQETTEFVVDTYGKLNSELVIADAGTQYEDRVIAKGFYGAGRDAHNHSYRELKVTAFRKAISKHLRRNKRNIRVMMLNGARADESENRKKHLKVYRPDPGMKNNIWVNLIHDWSQADRDEYLCARKCPVNPVAVALCRSGECMCGTMQTKAERVEAGVLYPKWKTWLDALEVEARRLHGFGWGEPFPKNKQPPAPLPANEALEASFCSDCRSVKAEDFI